MLEEAIDILTAMKLKAHFEKQFNKEAKIDLCIKAMKLVLSYEWLREAKRKVQSTSKRHTGTSKIQNENKRTRRRSKKTK